MMSTSMQITLTLEIFSAVIIAALINAEFVRHSGTAKSRKFTIVLIVFDFMILMNILMLSGIEKQNSVMTRICGTLKYVIQAIAYPLLINYLYREETGIRTIKKGDSLIMKMILYSGIAAAVFSLMNISTHLIFSVDQNGVCHFGKYNLFIDLLPAAEMCFFGMIILNDKHFISGIAPLIQFCIFPVIGALNRLNGSSISLLYPLSTLSLLLIYINFHVKSQHNLQKKELELAQSRLDLLFQQIQPHFLFNIMNTIYYLCDMDPDAAASATEELRTYIITRLENIDFKNPIPFEQELANVRRYTDLEKLRFDQIDFIYNIRTEDFTIPALSLQPLVENAVRHGCREMSGGRIVISSKENEKSWIVEVCDNGVGYQEKSHTDDGHRHVGIENVRFRLAEQSNAQLLITRSEEGGTLVQIVIPK